MPVSARKKDRKLNIAMVGHKRIPSREGGIEIVVEELSTRLVKMGHKVTCYNRNGHHVGGTKFDTYQGKEYKGVTLKYVPTVDIKGMAAVTSSFLGALGSAFGRYDVVHFHAEGPCAMLWIPKLLRKKCVVTIHGIDWKREKWKSGWGSQYIRMGEKCAVRYADQIIVLNKNTYEYFKNIYGRDTVIIPNGLGKQKIRNAGLIRDKFGIDKDEYILFLGRLVPEKGVHYLIKAYKNLETDKKLVIAGGVSDSQDYVMTIKALAGDDRRILFTDFVQGALLEELYSNAYVYVLPSDLEGMPLSLLEAMGYGNCCLVSDIPECMEVVGDKGVVFKRGDAGDLQDKLQMLCDSREVVENYKNVASDFVYQKYNWTDMAQKTEGLYKRLAQGYRDTFTIENDLGGKV
ncbi:Capsular glucan synthase [Acetatifactor muris]|uniref:Capsular glucan synthase n=1 Tax=Acetatifactor muris TaxID=879566 RepID=A0A2K4ZMD8_9FIRM|nr:Capsular glucan synthase [Acetatifactor muris]